jgi:hypothetical protein
MSGRSGKPSYLGLLNAIALNEANAYAYLTAWAAQTPNDDVRSVLLTVAAREGEHHMTFARRINELGYEVRPKHASTGAAGGDGGGGDDDDDDKAMAIATSDLSDLEKMERLRVHELDTGDEPDVFDGFFKDHSIDIRTGELLGRYIAEERDTARLLRSCYEQLRSTAEAGTSTSAA